MKNIFKRVLNNGLTIIVKPTKRIPKVSMQIWYNVGSKDEGSGEKGIAHFIEHMIFKGTKDLTESDINLIVQKLSGSCNAFTSYDYTGYMFDMPACHWQEALPIMADCMQNCTFKQELMNSELKAIIQELKMYRDNYAASLIESMIGSIFSEHPYHYPIIGYKQDLWRLKRDDLVNFYKKHYVSNNASLIIVGDVEPESVFEQADINFGSIKPSLTYKKEKYYFNKDLTSKTVVLYRDIKQPLYVMSFTIPGVKEDRDYLIDIVSWVLGSGRGSRLYKRLINEEQLVTEIESFAYDLFEEGLFFIYYQPRRVEDCEKIEQIIFEEIKGIIKNGLSDKELTRGLKKAEMAYLSLLESNKKQAYFIGKNYLAKEDANYINKYLVRYKKEQLEKDIENFLLKYFRSAIVNRGSVLPLPEEEKKEWLRIQDISDQEDKRVLSLKSRNVKVEPGVRVKDVHVKLPGKFDFPKYKKMKLDNGIKVLFWNNSNIGKIELILDLKAKHYYDPDDLQGLSIFLSYMLLEGTKRLRASELAEEIESYGMNLSAHPGFITMSMLSSDLKKGLKILTEILMDPMFTEESIEKIRSKLIADLYLFWDSPLQFINQLAKEQVYKGHPYSKNILGSIQSIKKISKKDILDFYKKYITPFKSRLVLAGDLKNYNLEKILNETIGNWVGPVVEDIKFPVLRKLKASELNFAINRDQVVLGFAGLSIKRKDPDFDKILILDQIFTGGLLGAMSSRLFKLREETGIFYTIKGSLLELSGEQPGMIFIKTLVSLDRMKEAELAIKKAVDSASENITDQELIDAKNAIINSLIDNFESNYQAAVTFLFLDKFNFPVDYFDNRAEAINLIKKEDIRNSAVKLLDSNNLMLLRVGRVK